MMSQTLPRSRVRSGATYIEQGNGRDSVVLIHGVGMRADVWYPQIKRLSRTHRVIAFDLPGHGGSPMLGGTPSLPDFVTWLVDALEELKLGAVNLVGHSLGALIAAGAVSGEPHSVSRVALLNVVSRRTPTASAAVIARADEIISGTFDREAPLSRWFTPQEIGGEPYMFVRSLLQAVDRNGYASAYRAFARGDRTYADSWTSVTRPALFVTGDGDPNSTPQMSQELASAAPRGRAVVIPGHRHMVNLTAPELVNNLLLDWLGACEMQPFGQAGNR